MSAPSQFLHVMADQIEQSAEIMRTQVQTLEASIASVDSLPIFARFVLLSRRAQALAKAQAQMLDAISAETSAIAEAMEKLDS